MTTVDIQGISVEMKTTTYLTTYEINFNFIYDETDDDHVSCATIRTNVSNRSDLTFDQVEEEINEWIEDRDLEVHEISRIAVKEVETFKKSVYREDGENYT